MIELINACIKDETVTDNQSNRRPGRGVDPDPAKTVGYMWDSFGSGEFFYSRNLNDGCDKKAVLSQR